MTEDLERALREDFAARARGLAVSTDIAQRAIDAAHRIRRRRRIAALTASTAALLVFAVAALWLPGVVADSEDDRNSAAPPADPAEFADIGVDILIDGDDGIDILTTDGTIVPTGLAEVHEAVKVTEGWVVNGVEADSGFEAVNFVKPGTRPDTLRRINGDPLSFVVDGTGRRLALTDPEARGELSMFELDDPIRLPSVTLSRMTLPDDTKPVALTREVVWLAPAEYEFEGPDAGIDFYMLQTVPLTEDAGFDGTGMGDLGMQGNVLAPMADGSVLVATPHEADPDNNTCLAVMDWYGLISDPNCYADFEVTWPEAAVNTTGEWAMVFTRDEDRPAGSWTMTQPWITLDQPDGGLNELSGLQDPEMHAAYRYDGNNEVVVVTTGGDWLRIGPGGQPVPQEVPDGAIEPIASHIR